jgi:hypothetical protein
MGFGNPTRYWQMNVEKIPNVNNKRDIWDRSVKEASDEYKTRMVRKPIKALTNFISLTNKILSVYFLN